MSLAPATSAERAPRWTSVLMCAPDEFDVIDVKNVFMQGHEGRVDRRLARAQWDGLRATYARLGVPVHLLPPLAGCEDMVFCANPASVYPRADGPPDVVLSRMNHDSRQREVAAFDTWFRAAGCEPVSLPDDAGHLEGHGDVLVVPGRRLAVAGFGGRTERRALDALAALIDVPLVPLPLVGDVFYHLDTCLALLDDETVLLHPPAFRPEALELLASLFPRRLQADPREAREQLAVNAHALADGHVLLPAQAPRTAAVLADAGYVPVPVDVSEFHKSGGSVFCMRMDLPDLPREP